MMQRLAENVRGVHLDLEWLPFDIFVIALLLVARDVRSVSETTIRIRDEVNDLRLLFVDPTKTLDSNDSSVRFDI
jgi:hypothetical protein